MAGSPDATVFEKIKNFIAKSSPLLGQSISAINPLAGVALSLLSHAFGVDATSPDALLAAMMKDPEAAVKLKQIELDNQVQLQKIISTNYAVEVSDREDARKNGQSYDWFLHLFAVFVTAGFFTCIALLFILKPDNSDRDILNMMLGALGSTWTQITSFYYGSMSKLSK